MDRPAEQEVLQRRGQTPARWQWVGGRGGKWGWENRPMFCRGRGSGDEGAGPRSSKSPCLREKTMATRKTVSHPPCCVARTVTSPGTDVTSSTLEGSLLAPAPGKPGPAYQARAGEGE